MLQAIQQRCYPCSRHWMRVMPNRIIRPEQVIAASNSAPQLLGKTKARVRCHTRCKFIYFVHS